MLMVLGPIHVAVLPGTKAISVRSVRIINFIIITIYGRMCNIRKNVQVQLLHCTKFRICYSFYACIRISHHISANVHLYFGGSFVDDIGSCSCSCPTGYKGDQCQIGKTLF